MDDLYKNTSLSLDDIYWRNWNSKGPWFLVADKIRTDLENTESMKEKIELLHEKQKEQAMAYLHLKKEKDEIYVINQSLEKRLGDAQNKAEKVPALEIEKKALMDREKHFKD